MASATQITTGKVRFSYCHVFKPKKSNGSEDEKYSVTLLIPKRDKKTLEKIKAATEAAKAAYMEKKGVKTPGLKSTLHDGDGLTPNGEEYGGECRGHYVLTVSSLMPPVIVDADKVPITDPRDLWSGCYGRAVINFYVFDNSGNKGVTAGLNGIMKLHDGEPLGGGVVTDADWDDDYDDDGDGMLD